VAAAAVMRASHRAARVTAAPAAALRSLSCEVRDTSYMLQKRPVTHHWPTSRMRCSSAVILLAGLVLVHVAHPASFSSLAYISYTLRVWPHSPR